MRLAKLHIMNQSIGIYHLVKIAMISLLFSSCIHAQTTYYVKSGGNDDADGLSDATAWATLSKVNGRTLSPGDTILFKRGSAWRETLTVPSSGTDGHYIVFTSYGEGENPKFFGSEKALNFVNVTGNIWGATNDLIDPASIPYGTSIWFHVMTDSIKWGNPKETWTSDFSNLTEEYDWTWHGDTIYVYAASDPDSRYDSIECGQRRNVIYLNKNDYIEVNAIDLFYGQVGVAGEYPVTGHTGLIVRNAHMAYFGIRDGEGYSSSAVYNNSLYEYNTIHDCGRRGISVRNYGDANIDTVVIQYNTFYNGYHTTGPDLACGGESGNDGNMTNVFIRNNLIFDLEDRPASEGTSEFIWIQSHKGGGSGTLSKVYIYNNIFKFPSMKGIGTDDVHEVYICSNTFYGHNNTIVGNTFHISVYLNCTNFTIKNNIFYTLLDYDTGGSGVCIYMDGNNYAEVDADYNIFYRTTGRIIEVNGTSYYMNDIATIRSQLGWEIHSPTPQDPLFVSADSLMVREGSPAEIGNGLVILGISSGNIGVADPSKVGATGSILTSSIKQKISHQLGISVFPNPANEYINILFLAGRNINQFTVRIFDISGKKTFETSISTIGNLIHIPINLNQGIYFVQVISGNLIMTNQKLVIVR